MNFHVTANILLEKNRSIDGRHINPRSMSIFNECTVHVNSNMQLF